jgi:hypothetical protein
LSASSERLKIDINMLLGSKIKELREEQGLLQRQLVTALK